MRGFRACFLGEGQIVSFHFMGKIFFMSCFEESDISSLKFKVYREARFIRREDVSLSPDF